MEVYGKTITGLGQSSNIFFYMLAQINCKGIQTLFKVLLIRLGPRVKKFKNGYPESSKDSYSINLKKYIWCIRNHCIASFSELHNATRANKVW